MKEMFNHYLDALQAFVIDDDELCNIVADRDRPGTLADIALSVAETLTGEQWDSGCGKRMVEFTLDRGVSAPVVAAGLAALSEQGRVVVLTRHEMAQLKWTHRVTDNGPFYIHADVHAAPATPLSRRRTVIKPKRTPVPRHTTR